MREQYLVYLETLRRLQETLGRTHGRHGKTFSDENVLDAEEVRTIAARKAGLSSAAKAIRLSGVFERGSTELQGQLNSGEISISAAYDQLPKRKKSTEVESQEHSEVVTTSHNGMWMNPFADGAIEVGESARVAQNDDDGVSVAPAPVQGEAMLMPSPAGLAISLNSATKTFDLDHASIPISLDAAIHRVAEHLEVMGWDDPQAASAEIRRIVQIIHDAMVKGKRAGPRHKSSGNLQRTLE